MSCYYACSMEQAMPCIRPGHLVIALLGLCCCTPAAYAGGLNFDAKLRRESTAVEDLVLAHIA